MPNIHSFDKHNIVQVLDPIASQISANTTATQPFAGGTGANRASYFLIYGAVGTSVIMKLTQATTLAFGTAKDITGATLVSITSAAPDGIASIEIGPNALDHHNSYTWVRAEVTAAGTVVWGAFLVRHQNRHAGVLAQHSTYTQQVRVYS